MKKIILSLFFLVLFFLGVLARFPNARTDMVESPSDWSNKYYGQFTYEEYREQVRRLYEVIPWYKEMIDKRPKHKAFIEGEIGGAPPLVAWHLGKVPPNVEKVIPASRRNLWWELRMDFYEIIARFKVIYFYPYVDKFKKLFK